MIRLKKSDKIASYCNSCESYLPSDGCWCCDACYAWLEGTLKKRRTHNDCPHYFYRYKEDDPYAYMAGDVLDVKAFNGKWAEENALFLLSL
jgi:hypothetical protein